MFWQNIMSVKKIRPKKNSPRCAHACDMKLPAKNRKNHIKPVFDRQIMIRRIYDCHIQMRSLRLHKSELILNL